MDEALLKQEIDFDEGNRLRMYPDSKGIPSIGRGHNLRDNPISPRASDVIYEDDLQIFVLGPLDHYLPWWRELPDAPARSLINMTFNMGIGKVLGFHQFLHFLQLKQYPQAAQALKNSKVFHDLPNRYGRICKRIDPAFKP